jgi:hypothetical protein
MHTHAHTRTVGMRRWVSTIARPAAPPFVLTPEDKVADDVAWALSQQEKAKAQEDETLAAKQTAAPLDAMIAAACLQWSSRIDGEQTPLSFTRAQLGRLSKDAQWNNMLHKNVTVWFKQPIRRAPTPPRLPTNRPAMPAAWKVSGYKDPEQLGFTFFKSLIVSELHAEDERAGRTATAQPINYSYAPGVSRFDRVEDINAALSARLNNVD